MRSRTVLASISLGVLLTVPVGIVALRPSPAHAQMPQGFSDGLLLRQMQKVPDALREYYNANDKSLPRQPEDIDKLLKKVCTRVFGSVPPNQEVQTSGAYRTLGMLRMTCDETITNTPPDQ